MTPEEFIAQLLAAVRRRFYEGRDNDYFRDRQLLTRAVTYPEYWLDEKGVRLPQARLLEITMGILATVQGHGNLDGVKFFPRYLLTCIQRHMDHHGDGYYHGAKAARDALDDVVANAGRKPAQADDTTERLAAAHRLLLATKPKPRGKKKADLRPVADPVQPSLF